MSATYRAGARAAALRPRTGNRLSAWGLRRLLPAEVAEAVLSGGMTCEVMPSAVRAVEEMRSLDSLAAYRGPVWLVNGERDPFRRDEAAFLSACRHGRLTLHPRRGHLSTLAGTATLAGLVRDAASAAACRAQAGTFAG